jgi:hypothetical protein
MPWRFFEGRGKVRMANKTGIIPRASWTRFTQDQRESLQKLRLFREQIDALEELALMPIAVVVQPRAAVADIKAQLTEVEEQARVLAEKLRALHNSPDMAHRGARALLEHGYWQVMPDDTGGMVAIVFVPRLDALACAAMEAAKIRRPQNRPSAPSWREIDTIQRALWAGFAEHYRSRGHNVPAYPERLRPHAKRHCDFGEVVAICCAAAGYDRFPKRAVEAFMQERCDRLRGITAAVAATK